MKKLMMALAAACGAVAVQAETTADYVRNGLVAMWDGYENAGQFKHENTPEVWVEVTGQQGNLVFPNGCVYDGVAFDVAKKGDKDHGCYISSCAALAQAIIDNNATVEIVCDLRSKVNDGTLFAFVDGNNSRILWARSYSSFPDGCVAVLDYFSTYSAAPYLAFDGGLLNQIRSYSFICNGAKCDVYKDGVATGKSATKSSATSSSSSAWFSIGCKRAQSSTSTAVADMKVYAIRIYNRKLTDDQIAANHAVDVKRFVEGDYESASDSVEVFTQYDVIPSVTPACGLHEGLEPGDTIPFSSPQNCTDVTGSWGYSCTGYRIYDRVFDPSQGIVDVEVDGSPFIGNSFTYTHGSTPRRVIWQYEATYLGTNVYVGAENGSWSEPSNWSKGEVPSAADVVVIEGKTVTLTGVGDGTTVKELVLKDGGFLKVQAPAAANPKNFATVYPSAYKFNVTEMFRIERGGTFQPITDVLTGNPVFVNCADFTLEEGGQIEASAMGYGWASQTGVDFAALDALGHVYVKQNDGYSYCPGAGTTYNGTPGYTSAGSRGASSVYGYAYAPWTSGAVSGLYNKFATDEKQWAGWARGGGAVVIFASGKQTIAGDIWANGVWRFYNGSTGGSVWLVANDFKICSTARLNANGASNASNYNTTYCGGRISLGAGLTAEHVSNLVTGQAPAQVSLAYGDNLNFINAHTYKGITATDAMIIDRTRTESGTRTYTVNTNLLTLVAVKGVGVRGADRIGGLLSVGSENPGTIGVEDLKGADESAVHYTASGWRLLDGETEIANGAGQTASWTLAEKHALLTLEWTIVSIEKDPEPDFFAGVPAGTGAEKAFVGEDGGDWDEPSNWSPSGVPGLTDLVTLEGKTVYAAGVIGAASLTVASDAKLVVGGNEADILAQTAADGERFGLKVTGDAAIAGEVSFGGKDLTAPLRVVIGGNLTLSGSAVLAVYAKRASKPDFATLYAEATPVAVAGKLTLNDTSRIVPDSDYLTGASVRFTAGSVEVAAGAKFDAVARGWGWTTKTGEFSHDIRGSRYTSDSISAAHQETYAPGSGGRLPKDSNITGAGYGGLGDRYHANAGRSYGYQYAPFLPGSCGYAQASRGAGAIWIECGGQFTLNGTLDATGSSLASGNANTSGGGIWVSAMGFAAGSQAQLLASGGSTPGSSYGAAGGRIALLLATSAEDRDALARGETPEGLTYDSAIAGVPTVTVAGGAGSYSSGTTPYMAANGTLATVRGTVKIPTVHVTGVPLEAVGPTYGDIATSLGATVSFTAPEYGTDPDAASVRYTCQGYLATNAVGDVVAQDTGRSASFTVEDDDVYFSWIWGNRETSMDVVVPPGGGSVTYDGRTYTENFSIWAAEGGELEAVAAAGYEFLYWLGDVPAGCERAAKIALPGGVYRSVTPVFRPAAAPATRTWLGGTGGWTDPAMWDGGVIPGLADTAVVESGVCLVSNYVACANLTVSGTAKLLAGCVLQSGKTTVVPTYPDASTLPYAGTVFERAAVELTGMLTVGGSAEMAVGANGQTVYPQVEANDIALAGSAKLYLTAGPRTAALTYGTGTGFLDVSNNLSIADTAKLYLRSDSYSGGSMVTTVGGTLTVAAGATVDADDLGFWVDVSKNPQSLEPLPQGTGYGSGAAHGSKNSWSSGTIYDYLYAPRMPGACGTSPYEGKATNTQPGGGCVIIHANSIDLAGSISASNVKHVGKYWGGAGGTIWLTVANNLKIAPGALLRAKGGYCLYSSGKDGAGGGRISVCRGLTDDEFAAILADGDTLPPGRFSRSARSTARHVLDAVAFTNIFKDVTVDVSGAPYAGKGTFVFLEGRGPGLKVIVK